MEIRETSSTPGPVARPLEPVAEEAAVPISPGSQSVSVGVQVTWTLIVNEQLRKEKSMGSADFYVDFNIEVPNLQEEFTLKVERELRKLASDHSDMVGAAVSLESLVKTETPYLYQVRIVVYKRPEDIAIIEKDSDPMIALNKALETLEKKIRASREKLAQDDSHRSEEIDTVFYELSADEVYATYAKNQKPTEVVHKNRDEIASELMVEQGLTEKAAYFAADQILFVAQKNTEGQE